jgi:methylenetetrahydrofolate--tRNA-(uracil-5-)-methyltransferase
VTAFGALLAHITGGADASTYQPMNVNFGLFPPLILEKKSKKADRKLLHTQRARAAFASWTDQLSSSPSELATELASA